MDRLLVLCVVAFLLSECGTIQQVIERRPSQVQEEQSSRQRDVWYQERDEYLHALRLQVDSIDTAVMRMEEAIPHGTRAHRNSTYRSLTTTRDTVGEVRLKLAEMNEMDKGRWMKEKPILISLMNELQQEYKIAKAQFLK